MRERWGDRGRDGEVGEGERERERVGEGWRNRDDRLNPQPFY